MKLSIVMPAYNEAAHVERAVCEWYEEVAPRVEALELVVVDDCSSDGTGARLEALRSRLPCLRVIRTPENSGHGPAVRVGLDRCTGDFVFQTDSDRQFAPADFWKLWAERESADFVFGVRATRADGGFRAVVSAGLRVVNLCLWGRWIADANCPFKLMRRDALQQVLAAIPPDAFLPMVMVSVLARREGFRVREITVRHFPRTAGQQSLAGLLKWTRVGRQCLRELLSLRAADALRAPGQASRGH